MTITGQLGAWLGLGFTFHRSFGLDDAAKRGRSALGGDGSRLLGVDRDLADGAVAGEDQTVMRR